MTRRRQKEEERLFAQRVIAILGETWTIQEPPNEREWPDLLVETTTGRFGLEIRKLYGDEESQGSRKRAAESSHVQQLNQVATRYYKSGAPPARVQFWGSPDDPVSLASDLVAMVPSMQIWEQKKCSYDDNQRLLYVCRLPNECGEYRRWEVVSDAVGWVGYLKPSTVQHAIREKSAKLTQYKIHVKDIRLLLVSDRTKNSGKNLFGNISGVETEGFENIYLLSFPDQLIQIP
jgi:hypothetical protein